MSNYPDGMSASDLHHVGEIEKNPSCYCDYSDPEDPVICDYCEEEEVEEEEMPEEVFCEKCGLSLTAAEIALGNVCLPCPRDAIEIEEVK